MKIHLVVAQREENYKGEFAPEVLGAIDEYAHDENPAYISEVLEKAKASKEFEAVAQITLEVPLSAVMQVLRPAQKVIPAEVVP